MIRSDPVILSKAAKAIIGVVVCHFNTRCLRKSAQKFAKELGEDRHIKVAERVGCYKTMEWQPPVVTRFGD